MLAQAVASQAGATCTQHGQAPAEAGRPHRCLGAEKHVPYKLLGQPHKAALNSALTGIKRLKGRCLSIICPDMAILTPRTATYSLTALTGIRRLEGRQHLLHHLLCPDQEHRVLGQLEGAQQAAHDADRRLEEVDAPGRVKLQVFGHPSPCPAPGSMYDP